MGWVIFISCAIIGILCLVKMLFTSSSKGSAQSMMLHQMDRLANEVVTKTIQTYNRIRQMHPEYDDVEALYFTVLETASIRQEEIDVQMSEYLKERCTAIEGACYFLALDLGPFKNLMVMRAAQLTAMIDKKLAKHNIPSCSSDTKLSLYQKFGLLECYERNPGFFS